MSQYAVEMLRNKRERIKPDVKLPIDQMTALENFVGAAHDKLIVKPTDRNKGQKWPKSFHWFDKFLKMSDGRAVIQITSYGPPQITREKGLFVYITKIVDEPEIVFSIQAPTSVFNINDGTARKLSMYMPEQFDLAAKIITGARPIRKSTYDRLVRKPSSARSTRAGHA